MITKTLLIDAGIEEKNIVDSNICSVCSSKLVHSKRAEGDDYALATAIIHIK